jgi:dipeptide transport system substrate-binding protein
MTAQLRWTGDNGDPDNFSVVRGCAGVRPRGMNITKWCNKEYDDMLNEARKLSDVATRSKLYEKMQVIKKEVAPDFKIAHSIVYETMRKEVYGFKQSPFGVHHFKGVELK